MQVSSKRLQTVRRLPAVLVTMSCSTDEREVCEILVGRAEENRPTGRPWRR